MQKSRLDIIGIGVYSLQEAARLTGVSRRRINRWLTGYHFHLADRTRFSPPVWKPQIPPIQGCPALGFLDVMEVRFVNAFRLHGVSWKSIRIAARHAQRLLNTSHPFSTRRFKTDGRTIFEEAVSETGEKRLLDIVKNQLAFREVLAPYLYEGLVFDRKDQVVQWKPFKSLRVVVDPNRAFGQPIVEDGGIPTTILANAVKADQTASEVAQWFEIRTRAVQDAVEFEKKLAA